MTRLKKNHTHSNPASNKFQVTAKTYAKFNRINGKHPFQKKTKDSYVAYRVRTRHGGKVTAFNYELAREIGLIPQNHPDKMTKELDKALIDTFAVVIINEYDQLNGIKFPEKDIKPNFYMATRYLQLQHPNKKGKTSGDGRSIWNGQLKTKEGVWDISSCGTGATCLSPATHIENKYFQTGDPSISYGCGYAELDEGLASLFFSEILHQNQLQTERVLGILTFPDGFAITIRVHDNLLRPSHLFNHLKQGNYEALELIVRYYIERQSESGKWSNLPTSWSAKLDYFLEKQTEVFAHTAAKFEDEYIFCWLDWDGDNVLMDGGIIDYGSVRQFGLFHSEYRFDDSDRFSTSIIEQKNKAKYTVQNFAQIVDYLKTKERKPLKEFTKGAWANDFERIFKDEKRRNLLHKCGFEEKVIDEIVTEVPDEVDAFMSAFRYFERTKSVLGPRPVNDGINWDAVFCMRDILRELPQLYLSRGEWISAAEFIEILKSSYAKREDLLVNAYRKRRIDDFQKSYWSLVKKAATLEKQTLNKVLLGLTMRSSVINKYDRVTGDSITTIINMLMKKIEEMTPDKLYKLLTHFRDYQNLDPDTDKEDHRGSWHKSSLMRGFLQVVREYREGL